MLLEARGIESGYGKVTVLHGIGLKVQAGEIVVVLGPNGAGKSTLLKAIAGHLPVTSGEILLEGERINGRDAAEISRAGVGYVPQENNIFGRLSVLENLRVSALSTPERMKDAVDSAFRRFPMLQERATQRSSTLSGGERQILAISSAAMTAPRLLLLDEPTSGLSPVFVETIVDWIVDLVGSDAASVLWVVEQNPEPVLAVSTRTYMLEAGQVTGELPSAELLKPGELQRVLLEDRATDSTVPATQQGPAPGRRVDGEEGRRGMEGIGRDDD